METPETEKIKLQKVYDKFVDVCLNNHPLEEIKPYVDEKFMGYGSALDEVLYGWSGMEWMIKRQREEFKENEFEFKRHPVFQKWDKQKKTALFVEEFEFTISLTEGNHGFTLRLSTLLEKKNKGWIITHFHGSTADNDTSEGNAWPIEEWKRRNAELQREVDIRTKELKSRNRELKIEASLERVQTSAMTMNKPKDLSEICKTIFTELKKLGFRNLRNTEIVLINKKREVAESFYYSDYGVSGIIEVDYKSNPILQKWVEDLDRGDDAFAEVIIDETGIKEWRDYRLSLGYKPDVKLSDAHNVYYYSYSIGVGALSISTFKSIDQHKINILKRFRNVFNLAYQRYCDISQAEAQTREALIEAALEKVRSRSMGMQKSAELEEVIRVVYDQITQLNIFIEHSGFIIDYKNRDDMHIWLADQNVAPSEVFIPYFDSPHWNSFIEAKEKGLNIFANYLDFEEKNKFYKELFTLIPGIPEETINHYLGVPALAISTVLIDDIGLYIENFSGVPYTEEENNILLRFGKVFQQTYTRFLDLQKAETQAREAKIEAALEKVRGRAMAMHHSYELLDLVAMFFQELTKLDMQLTRCLIWVFNDDQSSRWWMANPEDEKKADVFLIPHNEHPTYQAFLECWKKNEKLWEYELSGAVKVSFDKFLFEETELINLPSYVIEAMKAPEKVILTASFSNFGALQTAGLESLSDGNKDILKRFGMVFDQTYTRFLDLKKAEAQAREAKIEAALERVRSQSMAMQKSEDLSKVAASLFEQLRVFGGELFATGIVLCDEKKSYVEQWHYVPGAGMITPFFVPIDLDAIHSYRYNQWKKGVELFSIEITEDIIAPHFQKIYDLPSAQVVLEEFQTRGIQMPDTPKWEIDYGASFKNGYLLISALDPFEETQILPRFAKAFEQAYTRFLDLQKAEAQAREAQIEAALERVRTRSLAMHRTSELQSVIHTVHQELLNLNLAISGGSFIVINSEIEEEIHFWGSGGTAETSDEIYIPRYEKPFYTNLIKGIKSGPGFFTEEYSKGEKIEFFTFLFQHEPWSMLDSEKKIETLTAPGGYARSCCVSIHTSILIINHFGDIFTEDENDILQRFGKVFEQSYTRFLDLQKAEAQTREAKIEAALERTRTQSMIMQHSDELDTTSKVFHEQLLLLGIPSEFSYVWLPDVENEKHKFWATWNTKHDKSTNFPSKSITYDLDRTEPYTAACFEAWESDQVVHMVAISPEEVDQFFGTWTDLLSGAENLNANNFADGLYYAEAYMKYGCFGINIRRKLTDAEQDILRRFTVEFERTYTRFLDLKKAEAQAREAKVEMALERVRSKSIAMQKSEDLADLSFELVKQVQGLGIATWFCAYNIYDDDPRGSLEWGSNESGTYEKYRTPREGIFLKYYEVGQKGESFFVHEIGEDECPAHYEYLCSLPGVGEQLLSMKKAGIPFPTSQIDHVAFFKYGYILFITFEPVPESHDIFKRFAKVFEQTYTRFLDLQKAEEQAREAKIDAAIEKVRSCSLAMHTSDELNNVVTVLFEEFKGFEIPITAIGIHIYIEDSKDMIAYVCGESEEGIAISNYILPYFDNIISIDFHDARENELGYFVGNYSKEEKNSFYEYLFKLSDLKNVPDHIKNMIRESQSYTITTVLGKNSMISVNDFEGKYLSENEIDILRRFSVVFEQAYTRFLDLQKAEEQAREAQIETALERVRSRTMGMQQSDELQDAAFLLFQQVEALGVPTFGCGFNIWDEDKGHATAWMAGKDRLQPPFKTSSNEDIFLRIYEADNKGDSLFVEEQNGEALVEHYKYMTSIPVFKQVAEDMAEAGLSLPSVQIMHCAFFTQGYLMFITHEPVPDGHRIFQRFAKVFEQTYTRFLDLQKAEAQARLAQINLAVERVRARALAMFNSEEILEVVYKLKEEIMKLNIPDVVAATIHLEEKNGMHRMWDLSSIEIKDEKLHLPFDIGYRLEETNPEIFLRKIWNNDDSYFLVIQDVSDLQITFDWLRDNDKSKEADEAEQFVKATGLERLYHPTIQLNKGRMSIDLLEEPATEIESILKKMGGAFDLAYKRFEDLKNSEAQLREAQIEAALEKVRSRTMAMQSSKELPEAANLLFLEVQALGIPSWSCGYNLLSKDNKSATCWMSSEGVIQDPFPLYFAKEKSFLAMFDFFESNATFWVQELGGKDLIAHYDYMKTIPKIGELVISLEDAGISLPTYQINHLCKFSFGYLLFITYESVPDAHNIFKRFTKVFEQTYTRFLDLQKAEKQARESKIEAALERVRGRALAMQKPEELKEVAKVLRTEMGLLGIEELETCSIYINDEYTGKAECWYALKDIRASEKHLVSDHFVLDYHDTWVGREMLGLYNSSEKRKSIVMAGQNRKEWIRYCEEKSIPFRGYYGEVIPDRTYHLYKFSHGALGVASMADISVESWGLLKRAAAAFSLAYSRFRDLTQARLDLIKLKDEKKRAEDALSELQLTQAQLIQSEKMASLGELTAGIAHEIQNPLNFVNNFSEVNAELLQELKEEIENGDFEEVKAIVLDILQNTDKINLHGKRAESIVKGMLMHSRTSKGEKVATDINALCDEFLRLSYHGLRAKDRNFNADFEMDFDKSFPKIEVIPQDIGRVLLNLFNNAFQACAVKTLTELAEGIDRLESSSIQEKDNISGTALSGIVKVQTKNLGDKIEISVTDNGQGIPDEIKDKIFQPFFTTKPTGQGTGLGLSLAYDIVKAHGGEIIVTSQDKIGSIFRIFLPLKPALPNEI